MREVFEAQVEAGELAVLAQNVAKYFKLLRLTVRGQAHHFVFVTELRKAEILCDCRVVQTERVREWNCAVNLHAVAESHAPHRARKIAMAVGREQGRTREW